MPSRNIRRSNPNIKNAIGSMVATPSASPMASSRRNSILGRP
jgi:hypothetical protein